jgi:hypothetical protein
MIFKTIVPKYGDLSSYIGKPVLDKIDPIYNCDEKVVGVIKEAVEVENGFELTIELFDKTIKYEWINNEISSIAIE